MKKILSIALIAALVVASAFAGFSKTYASIDLGYNLDNTDYGFTNNNDFHYSMSFELGSETAEKADEGDIRAEIAAQFGAKIKVKDTDVSFHTVTLKITKANIIVKDVSFGILNAGKSATYAADYHVDDDPIRDEVTGLDGVPGFTVSAFGFKGGFGLKGNAKNETFAVLALAKTKSFDLVEGITAHAAGMKLTEVLMLLSPRFSSLLTLLLTSHMLIM